MKKENSRFAWTIVVLFAAFGVLSEFLIWMYYQKLSWALFILFLLLAACMLAAFFRYLQHQHQTIENAADQIASYLDGNAEARLDCNYEGDLYRLFHAVNTMAAILNAHAANELRDKDFLKTAISDISHQLKTPLAALNIYNGLLQSEAEGLPEIKAFADLSEQELDRMETLIENLLKITRLDAGTMEMEKTEQNIAEMMKDIALHFSYRAQMEHKTFTLLGSETVLFFCDRDWLLEAVSNVIKNAFDHTKEGDWIQVEWRQFASVLQIQIKDTGCGIHPEDVHHIFKRFYRSRFSQDIQGIGLGLPLAKAIIEAHNGTIEADSTLGEGTLFTIRFYIPTKL